MLGMHVDFFQKHGVEMELYLKNERKFFLPQL
jgi:hypothetical protein